MDKFIKTGEKQGLPGYIITYLDGAHQANK